VKRTGKMAEKGTNRFFQAITSPQLLRFGQEAIHSYLKKREAYLRQVKEAHDDNFKPATVLSFIDPDLLENAVIMGLFGENVDSVEKLTDDVVEKYLLGLAKSQQSVKTSFGKVVCELKAAELDFPSSVPKTGLYRQ
jgi:hypothetical protein